MLCSGAHRRRRWQSFHEGHPLSGLRSCAGVPSLGHNNPGGAGGGCLKRRARQGQPTTPEGGLEHLSLGDGRLRPVVWSGANCLSRRSCSSPAGLWSRERASPEWLVLEPKALPAFLANEPTRLIAADCSMTAFHLSRFIRGHERDARAG